MIVGRAFEAPLGESCLRNGIEREHTFRVFRSVSSRGGSSKKILDETEPDTAHEDVRRVEQTRSYASEQRIRNKSRDRKTVCKKKEVVESIVHGTIFQGRILRIVWGEE